MVYVPDTGEDRLTERLTLGYRCRRLWRFQASSATITATKDTVLIANTAAAPDAATNNPAIGGPTARAVSTATTAERCRGTKLLAWHELGLDRLPRRGRQRGGAADGEHQHQQRDRIQDACDRECCQHRGGDRRRTPAQR